MWQSAYRPCPQVDLNPIAFLDGSVQADLVRRREVKPIDSSTPPSSGSSA